MLLTRRSLVVGTAASATVAVVAIIQSPAALLHPKIGLFLTRNAGALSVRSFGATGDGRSDDRAAIQTAIDEIARSGGGSLVFPAGNFVVSRSKTAAFALELKSGVTLQGDGAASVLKLLEGSGGHLIDATGVSNCGVRNLVLDGNREWQPSTGHAFRSGGVAGLMLENLLIRNAYHYGIGLETGTIRNVTIDNIVIEGTGADGIDIKNKQNDDAAIAISNVIVRRWGLRRELDIQAGIDCRGRVRLSNVRIEQSVADDAVGIRMRQGEAWQANGIGAHFSTLSRFDIVMDGGRNQIGLDVVARSVTASDGAISGGLRGVQVNESKFRGSNIRVNGCSGVGILLDTHGSGLDADSALLSNCAVTRCAGNGIEIESNNVQILNCRSTGSRGRGLLIKQNANGTTVTGGDFSGNRAGRIVNLGANSRISVPVS